MDPYQRIKPGAAYPAVIHAFPEETAPRFVVRDRDKIFGERYRRAVELLGIEDVVTAARSCGRRKVRPAETP